MDWREKYKEHLTPTGQLKRTSSPELKTEVFIARANQLHGSAYDYSKVKYGKSNMEKVEIICPTHGVFEQAPNTHLRGYGCPKCVGKGKTTKGYIAEAGTVHNGKYDYTKTKYTFARDNIEVICPVHGSFFPTADNHLRGSGCPACANNTKKTTEEFVQQATLVHGDTYLYDLVEYKTTEDKVDIVCKVHGAFSQIAKKHLSGQGCPQCAGKNQDTIYLIEYLSAGTRVGTKVGITNNFDKRFSELKRASPYNMEFVQYWVVQDPRVIESAVLKRFTRVDNLGAGFAGSTEILKEPTEQIAQFIEGVVYASI